MCILFAATAIGQDTYRSSCSTTVRFSFSANVSPTQKSFIRDGITNGVDYLCRKTGYGTPDYFVTVSTNNDDLLKVLKELGYSESSAGNGPICAISPLGGILINSANPCWNWTFVDVKSRVARIMAHEYFHQVQRRLSKTQASETTGPDGVPLKGPAWLVEGAAELFGYMAIDDAGLKSFQEGVDLAETRALEKDSFELLEQEKGSDGSLSGC
jgi:hypothetical protein